MNEKFQITNVILECLKSTLNDSIDIEDLVNHYDVANNVLSAVIAKLDKHDKWKKWVFFELNNCYAIKLKEFTRDTTHMVNVNKIPQ